MCYRAGIQNHQYQYHFGTLSFQRMVYQKNASRWFISLCAVSASCSASGGKRRLSCFQIFLLCRSCLIQILSPPKTPFVLSALSDWVLSFWTHASALLLSSVSWLQWWLQCAQSKSLADEDNPSTGVWDPTSFCAGLLNCVVYRLNLHCWRQEFLEIFWFTCESVL